MQNLPQRFGAGGHVGRASGRAFDTRKNFPYPPYEKLDFTVALHKEGDVDARVWIRIEEVRSSIALIRQMLNLLVPAHYVAQPKARAGEGAAMVESFPWRCVHRFAAGRQGQTREFSCPRSILLPVATA